MQCVKASSPSSGSWCGLIRARSSGRASRPWIARAYAQRGFITGYGNQQNMHMKELESTIRKQLQRVELKPSPYDTAWVSMVPLRGSDHIPCFPQCVEWILKNQQDDGSWDIGQLGSSVNKSVLLSTLACVLALKKWNVGRENIWRGLHFIGKNFSIAMDDQNVAPIGFKITFSGLLSLATGMGLEVPTGQTDIDTILHLREVELKRLDADSSYGRKSYMAYVAEGLGDLLDWNEVMKFQRKNGSLFNSPSTTAAALIHGFNDQTLQYLNFLVRKSDGAVPAVYPLNIYCKLSMVDALEKMGISQYFVGEIRSILDMAYSSWLQKDEELIMDIETCAMAFRLLRMNGYDVSSDDFSQVAEESTFLDTLQGYLGNTKSIMELYRASKVRLLENEAILEGIGSWSCNLLKDKLCSNEVQYALKFPFYATLDRLEHKRNIENFDHRCSLMLKTEYLPYQATQEFHTFAVEEFCFCQSVYQDELRHLDSWVKDNKLDQLQFARQKLTYCYLSVAATVFPYELSDARISWAKNGVLGTVVDDFFDIGGSKEELENLIAVTEKWHEHHEDMFYSEQVKIVFSAIYTTANQLGAKASAAQGRDVTQQVAEIWLDLLRAMMTEAEWQRNQYVPSVEEYMTNAFVSIALGPIVHPALYFFGETIIENVVKDKEYSELFRLMGTCCRLLNDNQGFEREGSEGKLNSVSLLILHSGGSLSVESAKRSIQKSIDNCRRELLRLVLRKESSVPTACKEVFWKISKVFHMFYFQTDRYTSPKELVGAVNAVINEPLKLRNS